MVNINLFGGPSVGKSTCAYELFPKMKKHDYKVEFVPEYAKELTYGKDYTKLSDQLLILGEQHHRLFRLAGEVDMVIHDSPFIMGLVYLEDDPHLPKKEYKKLIVKMFKSYSNLNIFIERDDKTYQAYGRSQTLEECKQKDTEILALLDEYEIPYIKIKMSATITEDIYYEVRKYYERINSIISA
jgi:nicotinamide riboside kinase